MLSGVLFLRVIFLGGLLYCCCHAGCATLLFHIRTEVLSCVQLNIGVLARRRWATRAVLPWGTPLLVDRAPVVWVVATYGLFLR